MTNSDFSLMAAPIQGHTDAAYRAFHAQVYGDADAYFTPFIRAEKGAPRNRDLNDAFGPLNDGHRTVPPSDIPRCRRTPLSARCPEIRWSKRDRLEYGMSVPSSDRPRQRSSGHMQPGTRVRHCRNHL